MGEKRATIGERIMWYAGLIVGTLMGVAGGWVYWGLLGGTFGV